MANAPQTLTKDGKTRVFRTPSDVVAAKFDGWKSVDEKQAAQPTQTSD